MYNIAVNLRKLTFLLTYIVFKTHMVLNDELFDEDSNISDNEDLEPGLDEEEDLGKENWGDGEDDDAGDDDWN